MTRQPANASTVKWWNRHMHLMLPCTWCFLGICCIGPQSGDDILGTLHYFHNYVLICGTYVTTSLGMVAATDQLRRP